MMGIKSKCLCVAVAFLSSCASFKYVSDNFEGTYLQQGNANVKLVFNQGTFLHIDTYQQTHMPPYDCCDTISYGYWELEKPGVLKLFSDPKLYLPIDLVVKESSTDDDSVHFIITNPIEDMYEEGKRPDILYSLDIDSDARALRYSFTNYRDTNKITLGNPQAGKVRAFSISIYPKHTFRGRNIGTREATTIEYSVKNTSSNVFEIRIPDLDNGYLTYKRLNDDYVKIVSTNKLMWDGQEYVKSK